MFLVKVVVLILVFGFFGLILGMNWGFFMIEVMSQGVFYGGYWWWVVVLGFVMGFLSVGFVFVFFDVGQLFSYCFIFQW